MEEIIISSFLLLLIDSIYLANIGKPMFSKLVSKIQKEKLTTNLYGAIGSYLLLIVLINKFIITEKKSPFDAFLLGFCTYGVFDFTNYAIFKNYDMFTGLVDTLWGGLLFALVTWLTYNIKSYFFKKKIKYMISSLSE